MVKSHKQKEREIIRASVRGEFNTDFTKLVYCPKCKKNRLTPENLKRYGGCFTCNMQEKIKKKVIT